MPVSKFAILSEPECKELRELFADAQKHPDALSDGDKKFLTDIGPRFVKFTNTLFLSEKQWNWIHGIQKKLYET